MSVSCASGLLRMEAWLAIMALGVVPGLVSGQGAEYAAVDGPAVAGGQAYCWQELEAYHPPDFDAYFPDDPEGAAALKSFWQAPDRDTRSAETILAAVRSGLKHFEGDPMPILRWVGRKLIGSQAPQHPGAIELMYHAAGAGAPDEERPNIRGPAIYFGLSAVRPMTAPILRTLMEIAIADNDPNDLSRIAWGLGEQRGEALPYLKPFLESSDPAIRDKAAVVQQIVAREKNAFDWAADRAREHAELNFREALPRMVDALEDGRSADRLLMLGLIEQEGVLQIMDETQIKSFAQCAEDPSPAVRRLVARMVGQRWIWSIPEPDPDAVALAMALSRDPDRDVRYDAVYFGLSTLPRKSERIVRRLLEIAFEDREPNLYGRIAWGMRTQRDFARAVLDTYVTGEDKKLAAAAREVYADMGGGAASE